MHKHLYPNIVLFFETETRKYLENIISSFARKKSLISLLLAWEQIWKFILSFAPTWFFHVWSDPFLFSELLLCFYLRQLLRSALALDTQHTPVVLSLKESFRELCFRDIWYPSGELLRSFGNHPSVRFVFSSGNHPSVRFVFSSGNHPSVRFVFSSSNHPLVLLSLLQVLVLWHSRSY